MNESPGAAAVASAATIGHADRRWLFEGLGLTIVVIVLAVIFSLINPRFATVVNFINILTQASYYVIIAVGMTFVTSSVRQSNTVKSPWKNPVWSGIVFAVVM